MDGNTRVEVLTPRSQHNDWLSRDELATLTLDEVVRRMRAAGPLIAAEAAETERQRCPTEAAWSAVRKTGLFYSYVPKAFGGLGLNSFSAMIDVIPLIAENCASTAWCAVQCFFHQWLVGQFPEEFQHEIWDHRPYLSAAGSAFPPSKAVRVDGGYRVTGRHSWGTGVMYAQGVFAFAALETADEKPEAYCFFIPIDEVAVLDTWRMDGMAGTASHDFDVQDVFVPAHRAVNVARLAGGAGSDDRPLSHAPLTLVTTLAASLPILGAARAAVNDYRTRISTRGPDGGPSERALDHVRLARADVMVRLAELAIRDAAARSEGFKADTQAAKDLGIADIRAEFAYAAGLCRDAIRAISDACGSSAHALDHPLQRAVRDVAMLATHGGIELEMSLEHLGRTQLGLSLGRKTILNVG